MLQDINSVQEQLYPNRKYVQEQESPIDQRSGTTGRGDTEALIQFWEMIGKGKSIAHTGQSMGYGWNQEKGAELVHSQNLAGETAKQVTEEFKLVQEMNPRCQKNTLSFVLSPTKEDGKELTNKKLDEVMELLADELDGFNKSIERLKQLTENVDNIKVEASTDNIQKLLHRHLEKEKWNMESIEQNTNTIRKAVIKAKVIPRTLFWLTIAVWTISLVTICYLGIRVSRLYSIREKSFESGRQEVITTLRGFFDENPGLLESYETWRLKGKETDSIQAKK